MHYKNTLLLASQSAGRQQLLREAQIPFSVIAQNADENAACDWKLPFETVLKAIALSKMVHAQLPAGKKDNVCFVLTADTMGQDNECVIHAKPLDKMDAIKKIKALRPVGICGTAFCLDKKRFNGDEWEIEERIMECITAKYIFDMPDDWIEKYLQATPNYLQLSGGLSIEGYGAQFLKSINGSYTTILGLPMFEVREALQKLNFF